MLLYWAASRRDESVRDDVLAMWTGSIKVDGDGEPLNEVTRCLRKDLRTWPAQLFREFCQGYGPYCLTITLRKGKSRYPALFLLNMAK